MSTLGFGSAFSEGLSPLESELNKIIPEYQTVLTAMVIQPNKTLKTLQNNLTKTLVDNGIWAKGDRLYVFENHTNDNGEALLNWINPAQTATNVGTTHKPYFGMIPNGTSTYINSGFNPTTAGQKFQRNDATFLYYSRKRVWQHIGGGSASSRTSTQQGSTIGNPSGVINSAAFIATTGIPKQHGFIATTRTASNVDNLYINSVAKVVNTNVSAAPANYPFYVCGALNLAGTLYYNNAPISIVFIGSALTDQEIEIFRNAIDTYITANDINYRILPNAIATVNATTKQKLTIPTYVPANDEVVHPAVINCGSAWNGYQYWMAITPYTDGNDDYENPSIYASTDGLNWVVPAGLTNPVIAFPGGTSYNADPFLHFESGTNTMYLGYMRYNGSISLMYMTSSTDGITWGASTQIMSTADGQYQDATIVGSLVKVGSTYYVYYIGRYPNNGGTHIMRRSAASPTGPYSAVVENIDFVPPAGLDWWHFSVKYYNGKYYLLAHTCTGIVEPGPYIYIGVSNDGIQFKRNDTPLITANATEDGLYMPVFEIVGSELRVYYSIYNNVNRWELMTAEMEIL